MNVRTSHLPIIIAKKILTLNPTKKQLLSRYVKIMIYIHFLHSHIYNHKETIANNKKMLLAMVYLTFKLYFQTKKYTFHYQFH